MRAFSLNELMALGFGCRTFLYGEINAGRLGARKRGRRTLILAEDLDRWLKTFEEIKPKNVAAIRERSPALTGP